MGRVIIWIIWEVGPKSAVEVGKDRAVALSSVWEWLGLPSC